MEDEDREVARGGEAPGPSDGEGRSMLVCPNLRPGCEPRTSKVKFVGLTTCALNYEVKSCSLAMFITSTVQFNSSN